MVKRVRDLTQTPTDDVKVDTQKLVQDVEETTQLAKLSEEAIEESTTPKKTAVVVRRGKAICPLCEQQIDAKSIRFYDIALLKKFMSLRGKILPRSKTGLCATHQRAVVRAIKRARQVALLPYIYTGVD